MDGTYTPNTDDPGYTLPEWGITISYSGLRHWGNQQLGKHVCRDLCIRDKDMKPFTCGITDVAQHRMVILSTSPPTMVRKIKMFATGRGVPSHYVFC